MTNTYKMHNGWESFNTRTIGQKPASRNCILYLLCSCGNSPCHGTNKQLLQINFSATIPGFDCYDYTLQQNSNMSAFTLNEKSRQLCQPTNTFLLNYSGLRESNDQFLFCGAGFPPESYWLVNHNPLLVNVTQVRLYLLTT